MLESLAENPSETLTGLYRKLGVGVSRGNRIRQELNDLGLTVEYQMRVPGGKRPAVVLVPTQEGLESVNRPGLQGRGGPVHKHLQDLVATIAEANGFTAEVERKLASGGWVDVHAEKESLRIAVEIAVHSKPDREYKNIKKCLDAGYDRVLAVHLDPSLLLKTRSLFEKELISSDLARVAFVEVTGLTTTLRELLA